MWPGVWFINLGVACGCGFMVPETISKKLRPIGSSDIDSISQLIATIGVVAGMPLEAREIVMNRKYEDNKSFINDCNSFISFRAYSQTQVWFSE